MVLSILAVSARIAKIFRGGRMIKKHTLDTIIELSGIGSGIFAIYSTLTSFDTIAGGTLGVETGCPHLL